MSFEKAMDSLAKVADRTFNTVWLPANDAVQILDDLYEFRELMKNNGYDYDSNERDGKTTEEFYQRITTLLELLVGRKEFGKYLETDESYIVPYDKGFYTVKHSDYLKERKKVEEREKKNE